MGKQVPKTPKDSFYYENNKNYKTFKEVNKEGHELGFLS
jgi:hypothetical protein